MNETDVTTGDLLVALIPLALVALAAVAALVALARWRKKLAPESLAFLLHPPARNSMVAILIITAIAAILRIYQLATGASLGGELFDAVVILTISLCLLAIPYRWIDVASRENLPSGFHDSWWAQKLRSYRLPMRLALLAIFALIALDSTGIDIKSLLVAGGVGGLVAGFALKEILTDIFSGLSLQATPMINPGDVIRIVDKNIEGTIDEIGFRQTRLMTFERRPLLLPNTLIMTSIIEHLSHIESRRIQLMIGLRYDDYAVVKSVVDDLRAEIPQRPSVVDNDASLICFREYGAYSLNILVRVFTSKIDYREYCLEVEQVLHDIAAIVARHGAEFAFPTSVVHLAGEAEKTPTAAPR